MVREKNFKRCLKNKVGITFSLMISLLITSTINFAEELSVEEIKVLKKILKDIKDNGNKGTILLGEKAEALKEKGEQGFSPSISSNDTISIGNNSSVAGDGSIAIGKNALTGQRKNGGSSSLTIDEGASGAVAIGQNSRSKTAGSIALGNGAEAGYKIGFEGYKPYKGIAIGDGAQAIGGDRKYDEKNDDAGIAIGRKSKANGNYSITIGTEAETENGGNILIGGNAKTYALKDRENKDDTHPFGSIGIGTKSIVKGYNSIALGTEASVGRGESEMQNYLNKERDKFSGVAIGYKSNTERPASVSLGAYSNTYRQNMNKDDEKEKYGHRKEVTALYSNKKLVFKSFVDNYYGLGRKETGGDIVSGVVSVGGEYINNNKKTSFLRQIINLAEGTEDTDAVNLRQLKGLEEQMKMKFYNGGTYNNNNNNIYTPPVNSWSTTRMTFGKGLKAELVKDSEGNEYTNITVDSKNNDDLKGKTGEKGEKGEKGDPGLSAYDVWKTLPGNDRKTKEEFFESLKGKDGESGSGLFEYRMKTEEGDVSLVEAKDGKLYTKEFLDKNEYKNNEWFEKGTQTKSKNLSKNQHKKSDKDVFISSKEKNKTIGNVEAGVYYKDVVNVSQLNKVKTEVTNILNKVEKADEKANLALGGVSNAVAMANLVQVNSYSRHRHNLSAAYGYYGGSHALAIGFSGVNEKRNFVYKLSGSVNNHGNLALGLGIGVMLGKEDNEYPVNSKLQEEVKTLKEEVRMLKEALSKVK